MQFVFGAVVSLRHALWSGPLGACMLADFGADVVTICRSTKGRVLSQADPVSRGKRSIAIDLKSSQGLDLLKTLAKGADVFIEPFRPGVVEKMGCGPEVLCGLNPRLIYGRMTGWGQGGTKFEKAAGHDNNYIALSGALDIFRRENGRPQAPANFAGDYAGGGAMLAMGVLLALLERNNSGKGQVTPWRSIWLHAQGSSNSDCDVKVPDPDTLTPTLTLTLMLLLAVTVTLTLTVRFTLTLTLTLTLTVTLMQAIPVPARAGDRHCHGGRGQLRGPAPLQMATSGVHASG